jgi:hypothetical protein
MCKLLVQYALDDAAVGGDGEGRGIDAGRTFRLHGGGARLIRRMSRESGTSLRLMRL